MSTSAVIVIFTVFIIVAVLAAPSAIEMIYGFQIGIYAARHQDSFGALALKLYQNAIITKNQYNSIIYPIAKLCYEGKYDDARYILRINDIFFQQGVKALLEEYISLDENREIK